MSLVSLSKSFQALDRELKKRVIIVVRNTMMIASEIIVV